MSNLICYINGEYVPADIAALPINDLGIVRGYGVFDVLNTYDRKPFHLRAHIERLQRSAASIKLTLPWSTEELEQAVHDLLAHNYAAFPELGDVAVRVIATGGPSSTLFTPEQNPSLAILLSPLAPRDEALYARGARLVTVEMDPYMPEVKSLNYIGAIMAAQEATAAGGIEALYRTTDGLVTEGTRASFFMVKDNQVLTAKKNAVLDGITRRLVCELADKHFELVMTDLPYASIPDMDEAMLVGTGKEVLPIVEIDDMVIGDGAPGPVTNALIGLFKEYVVNYYR